jgi:hypothetical protein
MLQLCFEDTLEPVEWIDNPSMTIPLFNNEKEARSYLWMQHSVDDLEAWCYVLKEYVG